MDKYFGGLALKAHMVGEPRQLDEGTQITDTTMDWPPGLYRISAFVFWLLIFVFIQTWSNVFPPHKHILFLFTYFITPLLFAEFVFPLKSSF